MGAVGLPAFLSERHKSTCRRSASQRVLHKPLVASLPMAAVRVASVTSRREATTFMGLAPFRPMA